MKKSILAVLMLLVLAASQASVMACGTESGAGHGESSETEEAKKTT